MLFILPTIKRGVFLAARANAEQVVIDLKPRLRAATIGQEGSVAEGFLKGCLREFFNQLDVFFHGVNLFEIGERVKRFFSRP